LRRQTATQSTPEACPGAPSGQESRPLGQTTTSRERFSSSEGDAEGPFSGNSGRQYSGRPSSMPDRAKARRGRPPAGPNGEKTSTFPQFSARLPPETLDIIRALSRVLSVPQWRIIADAVDAYSKRDG